MRHEVLRIEYLCKTKNNQQLLQDMHLNLFAGEVVGLTGLGLSGTKAIMEILGGDEPFSSGRIFVQNELVADGDKKNFVSDARIFCMHASPMLIPNFTVSENLMMMYQQHIIKIRDSIVTERKLRKSAEALLWEFDIDLPLDVQVSALTLLQRRMMELIRAYACGLQIIVMDLNVDFFIPEERSTIFSLIAHLCKRGLTFLLLDTGCDSVLDIADRVVVLKNGRNLKTFNSKDLRTIQLEWLMDRESPFPEKPASVSENVVLQIQGIGGYIGEDKIDLSLHSGEVIGIYDASRMFARNLIEILSGKKSRSANVLLNGLPYHVSDLSEAVNKGVTILDYNMVQSSIFRNLSVAENISVSAQKRVFAGQFMRTKLLKYIKKQFLEKAKLASCDSVAALDDSSKSLLLLERWRMAHFSVLVCQNMFDAPTTSRTIWNELILEKSRQGVAVIIISVTPEPIMPICDRFILVSSNGRILSCEGKNLKKGLEQLSDM